ncbi:glycosyltransferase family protein [Neptuniibacter sp. CAU 1671]|uniref:glycosyltransferase family protein n=1 Tax=Neptuniibacter sp. CAU 1671 TaxID=3032593 RepID=UPI0023DB7F50|nr:glycosyltransferase family protein [Neptuniibacter sp. CAU 1671]MDF2183075.1 glycosyltransferase family protein [Neptuniibacter sp. CAU 1671]
MKILYGVQATGNGHITRARVMAPALAERGAEVDFLFSGRAPDQLFNMEPFGDYQCRSGLTFSMSKGKVNLWQTLVGNQYRQLIRDIRALDVSNYDLVISDFEPVTAWAARNQGAPSVGIAHQYAFLNALPDGAKWRVLKPQVKLFAPVQQAIGLHWDSFGGHCLPPLIQPPLFTPTQVTEKYVVYLPHDDLAELRQALQSYGDQQFYIYCGVTERSEVGNIVLCPFSREGFQRDLASCAGVICNAGFGLLSEAMQYGKKILCLPQQGQPEQISNARILAQLERGTVVKNLRAPEVKTWFDQSAPMATPWPDVGGMLADWLVSGRQLSLPELGERLWASVSNNQVSSVNNHHSGMIERT